MLFIGVVEHPDRLARRLELFHQGVVLFALGLQLFSELGGHHSLHLRVYINFRCQATGLR